MATRGSPKKILDNDYDFYLETIAKLEQVEKELRNNLELKDEEIGQLETEIDLLKEIIKSLAEVL